MAPAALVIVTVVTVVIIASGHGGSHDTAPAPTTARVQPSSPPRTAPDEPPRPAAAAPRPVALQAVGTMDPDGDGQEHDDQAPQASDGDPATCWATETYSGGFGKSGVGLVLDAGSRVTLASLTVTTDTPGFQAQIKAADSSHSSPSGPYTAISQPQTASSTTRFALKARPARYYLLLITQLDQVAHVNEVRAAT